MAFSRRRTPGPRRTHPRTMTPGGRPWARIAGVLVMLIITAVVIVVVGYLLGTPR